jgi:hypothetical protein
LDVPLGGEGGFESDDVVVAQLVVEVGNAVLSVNDDNLRPIADEAISKEECTVGLS